MQEITYRSPHFYEEVASHADPHVHLILIATKPDIIKQVPLYRELKQRGHTVVLGHTGQHYDENLSGGMLTEFVVEPDFNLNVRGRMDEVVSQIIGRLGSVLQELKKRGKIVIPYVHGDTTTAMAASNAGYCHGFASVHVEAGIRTLTPCYQDFGQRTSDFGNEHSGPLSAVRGPKSWEGFKDVSAWHQFLQARKSWARGSLEPYPEQFNTRCSEAGSGLHLAPVELDREFLLSEGFPEDRIVVVGNSVVDALTQAQGEIATSAIFERYPVLADGDFVRFCIHRRENCTSERRFRAIYGAMKNLIEEGRKVLLISMNQTGFAFERFGLKEEVAALAKAHPTFVCSSVWPTYLDVVAAMSRAAVCVTDSGSMQEEMNVLGVPCVTLRFGSDRSESVIAGGNIIAPPVEAGLVKNIIDYAWGNASMQSAPKIYGEDVSRKCIDVVEKVLASGEVFRSEEQRLSL